MIDSQHADATAANLGHWGSLAGAVWSFFSWFASSQAGVLFGILLGVIGLTVNIYFKRRQDIREQREHEARMKRIDTKPAEL